MLIELVDTFLDVFETRNFNRTADSLGITQSSVSARIRNLESHVGAQLFDRGRSGATPTSAGLRFEHHARFLRASWDHAKRETGVGEGYSSYLRLAGQFSIMRSVLIHWVAQLRETDRHQRIELQANYSTQIIRELSLGSIDIGVLYAPQYLPDLHIREEGLERFIMVSTRTNKLTGVQLEDYIYTGYTSYFDRCHEQLLPQFSSAAVNVGHEDLSIALLKQVGGTTYIPESLLSELETGMPDLSVVAGAPKIEQPIYSAVHMRKRHSRNVKNALSVLEKILGRK